MYHQREVGTMADFYEGNEIEEYYRQAIKFLDEDPSTVDVDVLDSMLALAPAVPSVSASVSIHGNGKRYCPRPFGIGGR